MSRPRGLWAGSEEGWRDWSVKAPRIHASVASRAGSGLSLPTICYGILCKEPLLSGSVSPPVIRGNPAPFPCGEVDTRKIRQGRRKPCGRSHLGVHDGGRRPCSGFPSGLTRVQAPLPPGRLSLPPSFPPCPRGALAPGMLRAADSLINSRLCGRPARTGRAPLAPARAAPLPQVSACPRACPGAGGASAGGGGDGSRARACGSESVCVGASSGFVRLCVCMGGCDPRVFACLFFKGSALAICAALRVPLSGDVWAVPPSLLDSRPLSGLALLALGFQVPALGTSQLGPREGGCGLTPCLGGPGGAAHGMAGAILPCHFECWGDRKPPGCLAPCPSLLKGWGL